MPTTWTATANTEWPGKGQRKYCIIVHRDDGSGDKLDKQYNTLAAAIRDARAINRSYWQRQNRIRNPYLGD